MPPSFGVFPWVTTNDKDNALVALKTIAPEMVEQALIDATKAKNPEVKRWATERLGELDGGK